MEYKLICRVDSQDVKNKTIMHSIPLNLCASFRSVGKAGVGTLMENKLIYWYTDG